MNNFLLFIAALLVLVLTALFAVPPMINWNDFRGAFEEEASRLLDREVRVRGDVSVRFLPVPYVSFEKVRIADAPGVPGSFARAEKFKMWLSVPPLLRGAFEARQIELEQPVIRLRTQADGSGNWRKLQISQRDLVYIPSDVALKSVLITDGALLFESHHGYEITKLGRITGEMTATALAGPYKFIGSMPLGQGADSVPHEVRFSTAPREENGDVRFSGSVRSPDGATVHSMNGTFSDLLASARAQGQVTSRSRPAPGPAGKEQGAGYELTADLKLDAEALRLNNISIAFQTRERQQTLTGTAITSWREGVTTQTNLNASWLDLDAIAGSSAADGPLKALERLMIRGFTPLGAGVTSFNLSIDQANLAGTAISDLKGRMVRRDGVTKIEALRASLPGLSALALDGFLERRDTGLHFDGNILLRSASLSEFAQWGQIKLNDTATRELSTSFSLNGNIRVRPKSWEVSDAVVKLADATAEGKASYDWSSRPSLVVAIDADRLPVGRFGKNLLAPKHIASYLGLRDAPAPRSDIVAPSRWHADADVSLRLRARDMTDGSRVFKNVDVDVRRTADAVDVRKFNATWQPGLTLAVSGQMTNRTTQPTGKLTGLVSVADDAGSAHLAELLNLASRTEVTPNWLAGRTPLRVAIDANLAAPAGTGSDKGTASLITADGTLGDDRIRVSARTFGRWQDWGGQPAEVTARISGRDAVTTTGWLVGKPIGAPVTAVTLHADAPDTKSPATIIMTAAGTPNQGMQTYMRVAAGDLLDADFKGTFSLKAGVASWSGDVDLKKTTAKNLALLAWPSLRNHVAPTPMRGRLKIRNTATGYQLEPQPLQIGTTEVTGTFDLTSGTERSRLNGHAKLSNASLSQLASLLMSAAPARRQLVAPRDRSDDIAWPDTPFDFAHLDGLEADVAISVGSLALNAASAPLKDAEFSVALNPEKISVRKFSARSGKATLQGSIDFEKSQAGARVTAQLQGSGIALPQWAPELARSKRLAGTADIDVSLAGQALSPQSLSSALDGKGTIRLSDVRVPGITTEEITAVAKKVIGGELLNEALGPQINELVGAGTVELGGPVLNVRIANGTVAFPAIVFDQDAGALRNETFIDLPRMRIDSQWTVTPAPQPRPDLPSETVALPPVTVVYAGKIATIDRIEPNVDLGDLERELVVRKMEANVARLERLRREDEARAAAETERQRKIEAERKRSIELERLRRLQEAEPTNDNVQPRSDTRSNQGTLPANAPPNSTAIAQPPSPTAPIVPATGSAQQSATNLNNNTPPEAGTPPPRRPRTRRKPRPAKKKFGPLSIFNN